VIEVTIRLDSGPSYGTRPADTIFAHDLAIAMPRTILTFTAFSRFNRLLRLKACLFAACGKSDEQERQIER
jgi:hypothetical protein